jgi:uncharacterized membrane protein YhdT
MSETHSKFSSTILYAIYFFIIFFFLSRFFPLFLGAPFPFHLACLLGCVLDMNLSSRVPKAFPLTESPQACHSLQV